MNSYFLKSPRKSRLIESLREQKENPFSIKEGKFNFGGLKDSVYQTDWTEESFLVDSSRKEMVSRSFDFSQLRYFIAFGLIALSILAIRSFWLQINRNDYYSLLSENNRLRAEIIEPKRGIIYARGMEPLVRNKANFVLYFRPIDLPKDELVRDDMLRRLSFILEGTAAIATAVNGGDPGMSVVADNATFYKLKDILSKVKRGTLESYQPLFVADNIEYDKAMLIAIDLPEWPGVFLSSKILREYLIGSGTSSPQVSGVSSFSHVLGYTGKINDEEMKDLSAGYSPIDYIGKMGIEYYWEKELKGKAGKKNIEVDALGRQKKAINEDPAQDGVNLRLSLDMGLQRKTEEVANAYLAKAGLQRASVIIINPKNGEIMALVSLPSYDNNAFARGISQKEYSQLIDNPDRPLFNRAVSGEFPSGSTIKPIFAAGALEEKIITETTSFLSQGGLRIGQWFFPDWKAGGHGVVNVREALAWSVNTFFYYIGGGFGDFRGLGVDGLVKYSHLFGLGELTGVDLPGERSGFVPTADWKEKTKNEAWYIGDTYHFAIGQGDVLVTPLQVANYTAAIANGGILYEPHIVSEIMSSDNKIIQKIGPKVIRDNIVSSENMNIVRAGMRDTVVYGSARSLNTLPVVVAGKTGTAQWSTKKEPHAWFIGFAPYDNPEMAITVLVEEGVEGSAIAVPIAKDILSWYYRERK